MVFDIGRNRAPRASHLSIAVLTAVVLIGVAGGAHRDRLFGPSRGESTEHESKRTSYQPRELQKARPTQEAVPAADPRSVTSLSKDLSANREQDTSSIGQGATSSQSSVVGDPLAANKVELLQRDITASIRARQLESAFARWTSYVASRVDASAGKSTGSELTGNCRLKWYDRLMRSPSAATAEAESFTRELHQAVLDGEPGFRAVLRTVREKLDCPSREHQPTPGVEWPERALEVLQDVLAKATADYAAAVAPLTKSEINELATRSYAVFVGANDVGHTLSDRAAARRLCDLMEKMDRGAMLAAGEDLLPLFRDEFRQQLQAMPDAGDITATGVSGRILKRITTEQGVILVGGREKNVYRLDEMPDVAAVIDLGGDDEYIDGTVSSQRPVLLVIDLAGDDVYHGTRPGIQGGAILGVSLLLDCNGNDTYDAADLAQGSSIAGIGILVDNCGNDTYKAQRRAQAHAIAGLGLLLDRGGNDDYRCAMWGQGFGGPLGLGLLDDLGGDDHYFLGGVYPDSYPETPGLEGWGQGVGAGIRQVANGGIGVLLDGSGDDLYEFDYLSHGGGYWFGLGFLRDFAGNDQHRGSTEVSYTGGTRKQPEYQRFGSGWGCHFAMGFLFDDAGDDVYRGWIMGMGFGWDCSLGVLTDFGGNDRYEAKGSTLQGNGAQGSMGVLFDYGGDDVYLGKSQAYADPGISYHPLPVCGGNFSFLVDYGGTDEYGCKAGNNAITQRGWAGGFLIDRPLFDESTETAPSEQHPDLSSSHPVASP